MTRNNGKLLVQTSIKDESLIKVRRQQIIKGAIKLFKEKGFHRATTRELAKAAGFSIGTLYEYIRTKEDVLYLVCDSIYEKVMDQVSSLSINAGTIKELQEAIQQYYSLIHNMADEFTIMYQETKSLSKDAMHYVLNKELKMVALFEQILKNCVQSGEIKLLDQEIYLTANYIVIQGQAWAFRKWALQKQFTIDDYIQYQVKTILFGIKQ